MKKLLLIFVLGIFFISFASAAWSNTTFNNSLTSEYLSFDTFLEMAPTGVSFSVSGEIASGSARGVTENGTFFWVTDLNGKEVVKYYMNGTYTGDSFSTSSEGTGFMQGITQNETFIWTVAPFDTQVYKYYINGTYTGDNFDTNSAGSTDPRGITQDGNFIWITDSNGQTIYKYQMDGTYTGTSFSVAGEIGGGSGTGAVGITIDGSFLWITDYTGKKVYKYQTDGTYTGTAVNIEFGGQSNAFVGGITNNGTQAWIVDSNYQKIFEYNLLNLIPHEITRYLNVPENLWVTNGFLDITGGNLWGEQGNVLAGSTINHISAMNSTDIALISAVTDDLKKMRFNGTDWTQVGNALSIPNMPGNPTVSGLNESDVAAYDPFLGDLKRYNFNGTDWTQVGNPLTGLTGTAYTTAISASNVAVMRTGLGNDLTMYSFNGTDWVKVGNELSIVNSDPSLTKLGPTTIAIIDRNPYAELTTYNFDGTDWTQVGNALPISGLAGNPQPTITNLDSTTIAFFDTGNDELRTYEFDGTDWTQTGGVLEIVGGGYPVITSLTETQIAYVDNNGLSTYSLIFPPTNPWLEVGTPDGTREWNYTGIYNITERTSNLALAINSYLSSCTYAGGFCLVPFIFHSDTLGVLQYSNMNFNNSGLVIESETFNTPVLEGSQQTFNLQILTNSQISAANLVYDGTSNPATFTDFGGIGFNYTVTETIFAPQVTTDTNKTFFWNILLADGTEVNTSANTQLVLDVSIGNCTQYNNTLLNYSLFDEETLDPLNGTIEVDINIFDLSYTTPVIQYNTTAANTNQICISIALTNSSYYLDAKAKYYAPGYRIEYYNIQKFLINVSLIPINIKLYDLEDALATRFLISYKGTNYLPVTDALITIAREYVGEGIFRTVEVPITDFDGKTVASLRKDDTTYTFFVSKHGVLLGTFQNIIPVCINELTEECEINLNSFTTTTPPTDFFNYNNLRYTLTYDDTTRDITTTFTTIDGASTTMLLEAQLYNRFENTTICSDSLTSSAGVLTCNVPVSYDNSTVIITLYKDGVIVTQQQLSLFPDTNAFFGSTRVIFVLILMLTIPFMFITSLTGMVIGGIVGLIFATLLLLSTGGTSLGITASVAWLIISGIIIVWRLSRQGGND